MYIKLFWSKNLCVLEEKKIRLKRFLGQKKFWFKKILVQKIFGSEIFWVKNFFCVKITFRGFETIEFILVLFVSGHFKNLKRRKIFLPHSAPSWVLSLAENLASSNLQGGATKWHYNCKEPSSHPPIHPAIHPSSYPAITRLSFISLYIWYVLCPPPSHKILDIFTLNWNVRCPPPPCLSNILDFCAVSPT